MGPFETLFLCFGASYQDERLSQKLKFVTKNETYDFVSTIYIQTFAVEIFSMIAVKFTASIPFASNDIEKLSSEAALEQTPPA